MASKSVDSALLQQALLDLGGSLPKYGVDGKWGKESQDAMYAVCQNYGIYYKTSTRSGPSVVVEPYSAAVLVIGIREIKAGRGVSNESLSISGVVGTLVLQKLLNKLGYLPDVINGKNQLDGKFGSNTNGALATASVKLGLSLKSASAYSGTGLAATSIDPAALYLKLWEQGLGVKPSVIVPTPAPSPIEPAIEPVITPSQAKTSKTYISGDVQRILASLGFSLGKAGIDNKWGKDSDAALKLAAKKYNLTYISSSYPKDRMTVKISPVGLVENLQQQAQPKPIPKPPKPKPTPKPAPTPAPTPTPTPKPTPAPKQKCPKGQKWDKKAKKCVARKPDEPEKKVIPAEPPEPKPEPKAPTEKSKGNQYDATDVQKLLNGLGAKIPVSKKWDNASEKALKSICKQLKLNLKSAKGKGSKVIIDPPDLVPSLQKAMENIRKNVTDKELKKAEADRKLKEKTLKNLQRQVKKQKAAQKKAADAANKKKDEANQIASQVQDLKKQLEAEKDPAKKAAIQSQIDKLTADAKKANDDANTAKAAADALQNQLNGTQGQLKQAQDSLNIALQHEQDARGQAGQPTGPITVSVTGGGAGGEAPVYQPSAGGGETGPAKMPTISTGPEVPSTAPTGPSAPEVPSTEGKKSNVGIVVAGVASIGALAMLMMKKKGPKLPKKAKGAISDPIVAINSALSDLGLRRKW